MDGDWVRLGKAVQAARSGKGFSQVQLSELAGVKRTVIQTIERGHEYRSVTRTLRSVERALGWGRTSVERILAGGGPLPADAPPRGESPGQPPPGYGDALPLRVARALSEGTVLDTAVVPVAPNAEMVVIVRAKPAATPEQIHAALLAWERWDGIPGRRDHRTITESPRSPEWPGPP